jgi:hypothetical protein
MAWLSRYLFDFEFLSLSIVNADIRQIRIHLDDMEE